MRPLLALVVTVLAFIGVIVLFTALRSAQGIPNAERPLAERYAEEEEQKAKQAQQNQQNAPPSTPNIPPAGSPERAAAFDKVSAGAVRVRLEFEGKDPIVLELYPKAAPKTVEHFIKLAREKFYDGQLVHRVQKGFVVQIGDPKSKTVNLNTAQIDRDTPLGDVINGLGEGGSGENVPLEANLPHTAYSIGLARSQAPDGGDSQFFISLQDNASLDGGYCAFGRVVEGQKVVDAVRLGDRIQSLTVVSDKS